MLNPPTDINVKNTSLQTSNTKDSLLLIVLIVVVIIAFIVLVFCSTHDIKILSSELITKKNLRECKKLQTTCQDLSNVVANIATEYKKKLLVSNDQALKTCENNFNELQELKNKKAITKGTYKQKCNQINILLAQIIREYNYMLSNYFNFWYYMLTS